jgi:hypothetical protein
MRLTKQLWILNREIKNKGLKDNRRKRNASLTGQEAVEVNRKSKSVSKINGDQR